MMARRSWLGVAVGLAAVALALLVSSTEAFLGVPATYARVGASDAAISGRSRRSIVFAVESEGKEALKKGELVDLLVEKSGVTKTTVQKMLTAFTEVVADSLHSGKKVSLASFGTFSTSTRQARTGRNPRTGEALQLPETTVVSFAPSKALKDKVNNRSSSS